MNIQEITVAVALRANLPILLEAREGTGKSTFSETLVTESLGWKFHPWILSQLDPTIIGGMPHKIDKEINGVVYPVIRRTPDEAFVETALDTDGIHVHMFDEFSNATGTQRSTMLDLVTGYRAGGYKMPRQTRFMAAMNPANCAVVYHDMAPPTSTRWCWLKWEPAYDRESWRTGMLTGWQVPVAPKLAENWEAHIPTARAMLVGFEKRDPTVFHEGFILGQNGDLSCPNPAQWLNRPRANPRTLEMAAKAYASTLGLMLPAGQVTAVRSNLLKGILGDASGRALLEYLTYSRDVPSPEEVLADPTGIDLREMRSDLKYLVASSVGAFVRGLVVNERNTSADMWGRGLSFVGHLEDQGLGDLATMCAGLFLTSEVGFPKNAKPPKNTIAKLMPTLREMRDIAAGEK
tara:strand:+ start:658 stop:1875 length:1218 start_codon:yes stop_codon:yes gene_type:complete